MSTCKRIATYLLAMMLLAATLLCVFAVPKAYADDSIGSITVDGETTDYRVYDLLQKDLEKLKYKTVTVEMFCDWTVRVRSDERHLVIPAGSIVTLNMNGHMIDRGLMATDGSDQTGQSEGDVIAVRKGAVLMVDGGWSDENHSAYAYTSTDADAQPSKVDELRGGVITGGSNTDGAGGICIEKDSTVTLRGVTIVGCRSNGGDGTQGFGGGIGLEDGKSTLNLDSCDITGCLATADGGGIHVGKAANPTINMDDSQVNGNYALKSGGGISLDGQDTLIIGGSNSSVSNNSAGENAGGIAIWNRLAKIRDLAVNDNRAQNGAGVYVRADGITLKNLTVQNNVAASQAGGIYISAEKADGVYGGRSTLWGCTVQGNKASRYGGIYIDDNSVIVSERSREITGTTIVKDNEASDGSGYNNLCIEVNDWTKNREAFDLAEDSEVWASYWVPESPADTHSLGVVTDKDCAECFRCDQSEYKFVFNADRQVIEPTRDSVDPATVGWVDPRNANHASQNENYEIADWGKAGVIKSYTIDGVDYDLVRGFNIHDNEDSLSVFYYSDGLFYGDPTKYNEHLGTLSWCWANAACYLNQDKPEMNGNIYYNKHAAARQFLADIGCSDQDIYVNDYNTVRPLTDSIGVSIGSKKLAQADGTETGDILIPIAVRGAGYEREWTSNVTLGTAAEMSPTKEAKGFASAANQVFAEVQYYLKKYGLEDELRDGKVKFWVTGYSRAGATANLTSKRLIELIKEKCTGDKKSQVFGYTCEAPKGGTDDAQNLSAENYYCIHNMLNMVDFVPYVAPEQMGFKRYGVDHYVPGTNAGTIMETKKSVSHGGAGGPNTVTTYRDNDPVKTKTDAYTAQKAKMLIQYQAMCGRNTFSDSFRPYALDFLHWGFPFDFETMYIYENGNEAGNRVEDFVIDFVRQIQDDPYPTVSSRDKYARDPLTWNGSSYSTIQELAQLLLEALNDMSGKEKDAFTSAAANIMDYIPKIANAPSDKDPYPLGFDAIYMMIGKWKTANVKQKDAWAKTLWNDLVKTGATNYLPVKYAMRLERCFPTLVDLAFSYLDGDYEYKPKEHSQSSGWASGSTETMMFLPTFMRASDYILSCHDSNLNIAWLRSYDDWYTQERTEYKLSRRDERSDKDDVPSAFGTVGDTQKVLEKSYEGEEKIDRLPGDQKIVLDTVTDFGGKPTVGEAIYYDLIYKSPTGPSGTRDLYLAKHQLYRGGIDLELKKNYYSPSSQYVIHAYDISYGAESQHVTYNIELYPATHNLIVWDKPASSASGSSGSGLGGQAVEDGLTSDGAQGLVAGTSPSLRDMEMGTQEDYRERPAGYQERTYTFAELQDVSFMASLPATDYFKTWKVQVLNADDTVRKEDVASSLLNGGQANPAVAFAMPAVDASTEDTYESGYQLRFIAEYGAKIDKVTAKPGVPKTDGNLEDQVMVTFSNGKYGYYTVNWTNGRGERSAGRAEPGTTYTATIHIDQDKANDIAFVDSPTLDTWTEEQGVTSASITWDSTGSGILIQLKFKTTDGENPDRDTEPDYTFYVVPKDLNTGLIDSDTVRRPYRIWWDEMVEDGDEPVRSIMAPTVPGERLVGWNVEKRTEDGSEAWYFPGTDIKLEDGKDPGASKYVVVRLPRTGPNPPDPEWEVDALYKPLLQNVDVNLYNEDGSAFEPAGDGAMPARTEMLVKVLNTYSIHPDYLELSWSSTVTDGMNEQGADYIGTVKIVPDENGKVLAKKVKDASGNPVDAEYQEISLNFLPADNLAATFGGNTKDVPYDLAKYSVSRVFHNGKYALAKVVQPMNIDDVAHGADESTVRKLLPKTTKVLTTRGFEFDAKSIDWTSVVVVEEQDGSLGARTWKASGTVVLPDNVDNPDNVSLDVSLLVYVKPAEKATIPTSTLSPGTYYTNQLMKLQTSETGGSVYFTTDGSDPKTSDTKVPDDGKSFYIARYAATPQSIDKDGKIIETPAVTIRAYTEVEGKYPSDTVEFQYAFADVKVPEGKRLAYNGKEQIGVEGGLFYKLEAISDDVTIDDDGNAVATEPGTYKVKATLELDSDWWEAEGETERSQEAKTIEFTITRTLTVKWLDGDGNVLDSKEYTEGQAEPTTDKVPTKAATAKFTYAFDRWDEGTIDGATKTYKPLFTETLNKYTVSFVNFDKTVLQTGELEYGAVPKYTGDLPHKPATAKATYAFAGWTPAVVPVEADATYTATFEAVPMPTPTPTPTPAGTYAVKFVKNAKNATGKMADQAMAVGKKATLSTNKFRLTGYRFAGWNTLANGKGKTYANKATVLNLANKTGAAVTLYAQWKANKYAVKFVKNAKRATGKMVKQTFTYAKKKALAANKFKRKGYVFAGWNTKANGKGKTYKNKARVVNLAKKNGAVVTLYAKWKRAAAKGALISKMAAKGKDGMTISWGKVANVDGYDVFFSRCNYGGEDGETFVPKKIRSVKGNKTFSITVKDLLPGTSYKAYTRAWVKKAGKKVYVKKSPSVHAFTVGKDKVSYSESSIVKLGKSKARVKVGEAFQIRASLGVPLENHLFPTTHTGVLRYIASNKKVAAVSKTGKVKAKAKGTCKIYVIAANGMGKAVTVTVK